MAEDKNQSPIRNQQLKVIGMFKDASPSGINPPDSMFKSNPQYAFDIKNMRFSPLDGPFLFDIVNEKGNTKLNIKNITTDLYEDQSIPDTDNLEIKGTPAFYINGEKLMGAQPIAKFKELIDKKLTAVEETTPNIK